MMLGWCLLVADEVGGEGKAGDEVGGEEGEGGGKGHDGKVLEEVVGDGLDAVELPNEVAHDGYVAEVDAKAEVGSVGYEALQFTPPICGKFTLVERSEEGGGEDGHEDG